MQEKKMRKMVPPDGGWGWIVVLGVGLVNLTTRALEPSFGLLFGSLLQDLSIATTGAGVIFSTYEAIVNFSGIFVGPLIKSYSTRKVAILGSLLAAAGLIATCPAQSMAHILITYSIIAGLGVGFSSSATFVSLNHYFRVKRGQAVGIAMTCTGLGLLLMPQAIRYLTEEYDFAGSILIVGAFALNACVGSALLQPVKWHLQQVREDEEDMLEPTETTDRMQIVAMTRPNSEVRLQSRYPTCPQMTIGRTIEEERDSGEDNPHNSLLSLESNGKPDDRVPARRISEFRPRFYLSKSYRKFSLTDKDWLTHEAFPVDQSRRFVDKPLNKSSTEVKFDRYFETDTTGIGRFSHKKHWFDSPDGKRAASSVCRKSSTISNLSNLDFGGSYLYLHAIENELKEEGINPEKSNDMDDSADDKRETIWQKISVFLDLDLLKDPVYVNILFGLSIFHVAEANFKMIVPFYLADLGHTKSETAFCLSMMAASDIAARIILPPICDRVKISIRLLFMVAAVCCGLSRSVLAESDVWLQFETILIVNGFFRGATLINYMLVIPEYCDNKLNKLPAALGIHMVAKGLFLVSISPVIGFVRDVTDSYPLCIHVQNLLIAVCVTAWIIEYLVVRRRQPKADIQQVNQT